MLTLGHKCRLGRPARDAKIWPEAAARAAKRHRLQRAACGSASDRLLDALRIRAVQPLGVSPSITRSAEMPIRVKRRQKARMIIDMSQVPCRSTDYLASAKAPGLKPWKGANPNRMSSPAASI